MANCRVGVPGNRGNPPGSPACRPVAALYRLAPAGALDVAPRAVGLTSAF
jgi:hypothetical protein